MISSKDPWSRLVAGFIDLTIVMVSIAGGLVVLDLARGAGAMARWSRGFSEGVIAMRDVPSAIVTIAIYALYFITLERSGATIGQRWQRLRVVSDTGERVTLGQAAIRAALRPLALVTLFVPSRDGRALHDRLSKTSVVST